MDPILQINHLSKAFGANLVLRDIDFTVSKGDVISIIGASGSGKSTLLRCINLLEEADSGSIWFDGQDLMDLSVNLNALRQKIGMVFQSYDLFPHLNVIDNILLGPLKAQKRNKEEVLKEAKEWLELVGLPDKATSFPRELSGGQKQRVAIVRALCMHPEVMLFDEVTAALDPEMVREVLDVMMNLAKDGKTMLIVTHQLEFARAVADKIVFMDQGQIVEETTPGQFFNNPTSQRGRAFLESFTFAPRHEK